MSRILRAVVTTAWIIMAGLYVLFISGVMPELWEVVQSMPAVRNGPFYERAKQLKWVATYAVPALLFLSPLAWWVVGGVRNEANKQRLPR
jgi:hypothetical protein